MKDTNTTIYRNLKAILSIEIIGTSAGSCATIATGRLEVAGILFAFAIGIAALGTRLYFQAFGCPVCEHELERGNVCRICAEEGFVTPVMHDPVKGQPVEKVYSGVICSAHYILNDKLNKRQRFEMWKAQNKYCRQQLEHAGQILLIDS